jgi:nitroreductase
MAPAPSQEEIDQIMACAMRAPDHARLKPWRYYLVSGESRAVLGDVFAQVAQKDTNASADKIEKCRNMPMRAPMLIVAVCNPQANPKVPSLEQFLAVGAGVQNIQLAINSLGYSSVWRTGDMVHAPEVKKAFDVSEEGEIIAFLYVGTAQKIPAKPMVDTSEFVQNWK